MTTIRLKSINTEATKIIINRTQRNCGGRQTIKVYNAIIEYVSDLTGKIIKENKGYFLFHYNSPIVCYDKVRNAFIFDYRYYDYSTSTSNVRNRFYEWFTYQFNWVNTKDLRKIEKQKIKYFNFYGTPIQISMQVTSKEYFDLKQKKSVDEINTNYYILNKDSLYN